MSKVATQIEVQACTAGTWDIWRSRAGAEWTTSRIIETLLTWQERATRRTHLSETDPFLLRDMGLTRADASYEAAKPFWRV
jgi:uncharacterized protein YjiS (DUF1127 family)